MLPEARRPALILFALLAFLYLWGSTKAGVLGPDEPRYAAIGREMAASGDWVTPRLWGKPWFEKPPLLYWMTAAATRAGLGPDAAPRIPVALLGLGFLLFFYWYVDREFGIAEALASTAILGTSAGWLAYSLAAVTDVPLSATFGASLLLVLTPGRRRAAVAGLFLGLAILAKGLVPLVLFIPLLWTLRRRLPEAALIFGVAALTAAPWYVAVTAANGSAFVDEFIWKHHFQRFTSDTLQHVRPWWFFIPVLLAGIFPWTAAAGLLRRRLFDDPRLRLLALWTGWALLFFSASKNKLPGYVLPLLPAVSLILGVAIARAGRSKVSLPLTALLIAVLPIAAGILPQALVYGLSRSKPPQIDWIWIAAGVFAAAVCYLLEFQNRRADAVLLIAMGLGLVLFRSKVAVLPVLDRAVSVRPFYIRHQNWVGDACLDHVGRDAEYGLNYYAGRSLPVCADAAARPRILESGRHLVLLR